MSADHNPKQDRRSVLAALGAALAQATVAPFAGCLPPRAVHANKPDTEQLRVEHGIEHLQQAIGACAPKNIDIIPKNTELSVIVDLGDQRVTMTHLVGERTIKIKTCCFPGETPVAQLTFNVREPVDSRDRHDSYYDAAWSILREAISKRVDFHASTSPGHSELAKIFFAEKGVDPGRDIKIRRTLQSTSIAVSLPGQEQLEKSVETSQPSLIISLKRTQSPNSLISDRYEGFIGSFLSNNSEAWCEARAAATLLEVEGEDIYSGNLIYRLSPGEAKRLFMLFTKKREEGPIYASLGQSTGP